MNKTYKFEYVGPKEDGDGPRMVAYEFKTNDMLHWHNVCHLFLKYLSSVYGYEITPKMVVENTKFFWEA